MWSDDCRHGIFDEVKLYLSAHPAAHTNASGCLLDQGSQGADSRAKRFLIGPLLNRGNVLPPSLVIACDHAADLLVPVRIEKCNG
ncbi:MAG TPA: hypothetical protein VND64_33465 [Pirellulales bacterium]|nr:hypothetical protein [Pirellulales bacterium]